MVEVWALVRLGGVDVTDCTADWTIRVRFPTHPHRVCWPSDGKEVKDVFGRAGARIGVSLARLRPLDVKGVGCPAAGLSLENG